LRAYPAAGSGEKEGEQHLRKAAGRFDEIRNEHLAILPDYGRLAKRVAG
jgi:hypothetical protein